MVDVEDPLASVYVLNEDHLAVLVATTGREHERSGRFAAGEEVVFAFTFENVLAPGRYNPLFTLAHRGTGLDLMDRFEGSFSFLVTGPLALGGLVDLPVEVASPGSAGAGASRRERRQRDRSAGGRVSSEPSPDSLRRSALRGSRAPDQGPPRAHRRLDALLAPHLQHRAQRIQAASSSARCSATCGR